MNEPSVEYAEKFAYNRAGAHSFPNEAPPQSEEEPKPAPNREDEPEPNDELEPEPSLEPVPLELSGDE